MNKTLHTLKYISSDLISAIISWIAFYSYRKLFIEPQKFGYDIPIEFTARFYIGIIVIPIFWLFLYYITGYYKDIYRKSRLKELGQTILTTLIGVVIIFFTSMIDDEIVSYQNYYRMFLALLSIHFIATYIPRLIITTQTNIKIHKRIYGFNTLVIGDNKKAVEIYNNIENQIESAGNRFVGFISLVEKENYLLQKYIPNLGSVNQINDVLEENNIEEIIIALESSEHKEIEKIINNLQINNTIIKVIPSMYDILTGKVKMAQIYGTPLIQISHSLMPTWQEHTKQVIDFVVALTALVFFSPLIIFLALGVKLSSKGPILYVHERIGRFGKPFTMYKFRSMTADAESNGPALSSKNDCRITPFGKFMRKSKLDELPNFYNVLKGDMSLVGPRPERKYYIDQIIQKAPHYLHLQKVKPGITSWGQVKYGYAENVNQMIERLKYDILYIENMSLYVDFKIMIYTILIILKGRHI